MIPATTLHGKKVALFGLGGSGIVTAEAMVAAQVDVTAFDDNPDSVALAEAKSIRCADFRDEPFDEYHALVLAPGVPLTHPKPHWVVELAHKNKVPIIGDVELFCGERNVHAPGSTLIAITGTNGKSTTTALISHILEQAGRKTYMGGNIGKAVLSLDHLEDDAFYVVECSSYQIELAPNLNPTIGILLNLAPDHLDRHGTMENYSEIKTRLVRASAHSIVGRDDLHCVGIAKELSGRVDDLQGISSLSHDVDRGVVSDDGHLFQRGNGGSRKVASLRHAGSLRGNHNGQNAAAAWLACHLAGLSDSEIQEGLNSFGGLAHRMQIFSRIGRSLYVNDSKATNADAAAQALASFDRIYWIAGGLAKDGGIESLKSFFPKIAKAYLIGEAAPEFAATLGGQVPFEISSTMDVAVEHAHKDAQADAHQEPVVLLSPACASFDQFRNFEIRGDAFVNAVNSLDPVALQQEAS